MWPQSPPQCQMGKARRINKIPASFLLPLLSIPGTFEALLQCNHMLCLWLLPLVFPVWLLQGRQDTASDFKEAGIELSGTLEEGLPCCGQLFP